MKAPNGAHVRILPVPRTCSTPPKIRSGKRHLVRCFEGSRFEGLDCDCVIVHNPLTAKTGRSPVEFTSISPEIKYRSHASQPRGTRQTFAGGGKNRTNVNLADCRDERDSKECAGRGTMITNKPGCRVPFTSGDELQEMWRTTCALHPCRDSIIFRPHVVGQSERLRFLQVLSIRTVVRRSDRLETVNTAHDRGALGLGYVMHGLQSRTASYLR